MRDDRETPVTGIRYFPGRFYSGSCLKNAIYGFQRLAVRQDKPFNSEDERWFSFHELVATGEDYL